MFEQFLSLFRGQVRSAVVEGTAEGIEASAIRTELKEEVRQAVIAGVQDALGSLHTLLEAPATSNGQSRIGALNGHANGHSNGRKRKAAATGTTSQQ